MQTIFSLTQTFVSSCLKRKPFLGFTLFRGERVWTKNLKYQIIEINIWIFLEFQYLHHSRIQKKAQTLHQYTQPTHFSNIFLLNLKYKAGLTLAPKSLPPVPTVEKQETNRRLILCGRVDWLHLGEIRRQRYEKQLCFYQLNFATEASKLKNSGDQKLIICCFAPSLLSQILVNVQNSGV